MDAPEEGALAIMLRRGLEKTAETRRERGELTLLNGNAVDP